MALKHVPVVRKPEEIKKATFKGLYLEDFLILERFLEHVITEFFNCSSSKKNEKFQTLLTYTMYPNQGFTTPLKIECVRSIIQLATPDFYKTIKFKEKSPLIFVLLSKLNDFRNLIAHNVNYYYIPTGSIVAIKRKNDFKASQTKSRKAGKLIVKDDWKHVQVDDLFVIDDDLQEEVFIQLASIKFFLNGYYLYYRSLYNKINKTSSKEFLKMLIQIAESTDLNDKKGGIFGILKNQDARKEQEQENANTGSK